MVRTGVVHVTHLVPRVFHIKRQTKVVRCVATSIIPGILFICGILFTASPHLCSKTGCGFFLCGFSEDDVGVESEEGLSASISF